MFKKLVLVLVFLVFVVFLFLIGSGDWAMEKISFNHLTEPKFEVEWMIHESSKFSDIGRSGYAYNTDFKTILYENHNDFESYFSLLESRIPEDNFTRGEILILKGRVFDNHSLFCSSIPFFESFSQSSEGREKAVALESLYSMHLECGERKPGLIEEARRIWEKEGVEWRSDLLKAILDGRQYGELSNQEFAHNISVPPNASFLTVGRTELVIDSEDKIGIQSDRGSRDWASGIFRRTFSLDPLITYFEGGRVNEASRYSGAETVILTGTIVQRFGSHWYAPDEEGNFKYLVLKDKIEFYPTVKFLSDDYALMTDTHGVSSLVPQAVEEDVDLVVGCCDYLDKITAAEHLSKKGLNVYCVADRFLPYTLGFTQAKGKIIGGAPVREEDGNAVIGGQEISLSLSEPIVVQDTMDAYPNQYYDTPARYFYYLEKYSGVDFNKTVFDTSEGDLSMLLERADFVGADVVGVRIVNYFEREALSDWLEKDGSHRAILFHTAGYPEGYSLFFDFENQTSFADAYPVFS